VKQFIVLLAFVLGSSFAGGARADEAAVAGKSLIANGGFEETRDGKVAGWGLNAPGVTVEEEGGNHFLRLKVATSGEPVMVFRRVEIPKDVGAVELKYRVRYEGIKKGKENYFDGRIMMNFKDASGGAAKPGPSAPSYRGTSKGWVDRSQQVRVPAGAVALEMNFALGPFRVTGQAYFALTPSMMMARVV